MITIRDDASRRICQGDIFKDLEYIEYVEERSGNIEVSKIQFPLVMVLTQDCDLEQDYGSRCSKQVKHQDKWLLSVLVAPLYNADHVFRGEHLSQLHMKMQTIRSNRPHGNFLKTNQLPRYHYLDCPESAPILPSVIDFKHYFSADVRYINRIRSTKYVCSVSNLYREDILLRFANFLSRIGLPEAIGA